MGIALLVIALVFALFFLFSGKTSFLGQGASNKNPLSVQNKSVTDLIKVDTDGDGIADWEEELWGTDKNRKATFNNISDSTYIANKKKELNVEQEGIRNAENLTETEKFAREFFQGFAALQASGEVDANTINNFSNALGQNIVNPQLVDMYTEKDAKLGEKDDAVAQANYYFAVKILFDKHKEDGLGNELSIVSEGLATSDSSLSGVGATPAGYTELLVIGQSYQDFAKEVINVSVPKSLLSYHLRIANGANNTGLSIMNMKKIVDDPIVGLSGLSEYQKYSDELITAVTDLEGALVGEE